MSNEERVTERTKHLPDGGEILRLRETPNPEDNNRPYTFAAIGARYGVSRQAVHKALLKWQTAQEGAQESTQEQATS